MKCDYNCLNCKLPQCKYDLEKPKTEKEPKQERVRHDDAYRYRLWKQRHPEQYEIIKARMRVQNLQRYYDRKAAGICVLCGKDKATHGIHCEVCGKKTADRMREYKRKQAAERRGKAV